MTMSMVAFILSSIKLSWVELSWALRAAQACRYLIYSEADFEVFRPTGVTRSTDGGEIWHGGGDLCAKFNPHRCNDRGSGPQNWYFYSDLTKIWNINAPQRSIPCTIFFYKIYRFSTSSQDALGVKIWLDLLEGWWSYGGFKLRASGFPHIFSAP